MVNGLGNPDMRRYTGKYYIAASMYIINLHTLPGQEMSIRKMPLIEREP